MASSIKYGKQQNLNDSESLNYGRDVRQMQTLFKEMQDGENKNRSLGQKTMKLRGSQNQFSQPEIDRLQQEPQQNYQAQNFNELDVNYREKISSLENHLAKSNKANELLYEKLHEQEEQLKDLKQQMTRVHGEKSWKQNQVDDLNFRFHDVSQTHNEFLKNARNHSQTLLKELEQKDKKIAQLQKYLDEYTGKLGVVTITQEKNFDKCLDFDKRIRELENENMDLKLKLQNQKQDNDVLVLNKKAEGTFMVEVEHLRADAKRLVSMLKQTTEFKDFADLADDAGQIRFLKGVKAKSYVDYGAPCKCKINRPCVDNEIVDESNLWCPEEAWKFAHNFRLQYDGELTETLIERLLYEFAKIWSRREQRTIHRIKGNCAHEVASLRRQLVNNPKYDEHQAKATITRLKQQLKEAFRENRNIYADRYAKNPPGTKWVAETVKMARNANKQAKKAHEQNRFLREKLHDIEKLRFQDNSEKTLFMEGAAWVARTIYKDSEKLNKEWKALSSNFQRGDANVQTIDQIMSNYNSKVHSYKANCQKEMLLAEQQIARVNRPSSASVGLVMNDGF